MKEDNAVVLTKLAFHDAATATQPSSVSHSIRLQDYKIPQLTVRGYLVDVQKCEAIQKSGVDFALLDSSCESAVKSIIDDLHMSAHMSAIFSLIPSFSSKAAAVLACTSPT